MFDAARILRLPGTVNRKDPKNPVEVELEVLEPGQRYNASEVEESLDLVVAVEDGPEPSSQADGQAASGRAPHLPARVRDLISSKPRIANLFVGKGKPETGPDGRLLDSSSSGYDFSFLIALAKAGVRDPGELAAALQSRPDGRAQKKGPAYIQRTVQRAITQFEGATAKALKDMVDFEVEQLRVFKSEPATYEFTIEGHQIVLSSAQLRRPSVFATAVLDTIHRIPAHPTGSDWAELVNLWLTEAEYVDMPPEASSELALREDVERLVEELPVGEAVFDLDHGKALLIEGTRSFKAKALMRGLREDYPNLAGNRLCKTLRDLGFDSGTVRLDGTPVRLWRRVTGSAPIRAREKPEVE